MSQVFFAQNAARWDDIRAAMFSDEVRDAVLARAGLYRGAVVADVGAGTGFISQALAERAAHVYVVDPSAEMLAVARDKLSGLDNVEYRVGEGGRLPLPEGKLDAVVANMALHHMADPAAGIADMARKLKPGGRLVIADADEHGHAWLREEQGDVWLGLNRAQVRDWLEAAGLVDVLVEDSRQTCRCSSQAGDDHAAVEIFVASGTRPDPRMDEAVKEHYRQAALGPAAVGCCAPATATQPASSCCAPATANQPASSCCAPATANQPAAGCCAPAAAAQPASSCCAPAAAAQPASSCCAPATAAQPGPAVTDHNGETEADLALGCGNAVALAALRPGETVLDIGCGAGADVFPAAALVGMAGKVIGVDRLPEMLERAQRTATRLGVPNVEFRQGEALALPAAEGEANVVMSNCVINLVQDKGRAFREAYRVLAAGGRLAISDVVTDRPFSPALRRDATSWAACVTGALPEAEYLALIRQAGFRDVRAARSQAWPAEDGTQVYSLLVTAVKSAG